MANYILTISAHSRLYTTRKTAHEAANKVLKTRSGGLKAIVTVPRRLKNGYRFTLKTFFMAGNLKEARAAAVRAKKAAPGVMTKIDKV